MKYTKEQWRGIQNRLTQIYDQIDNNIPEVDKDNSIDIRFSIEIQEIIKNTAAIDGIKPKKDEYYEGRQAVGKLVERYL